jgi:S-formylglutathione hydrolase FrmB
LLGRQRQSGNSVRTELIKGRLRLRNGCGQFALEETNRARILGRRWRRWGQGALTAYLGGSRGVYALIEEGRRLPDLLADQGTADPFLEAQLKTHLPVHACEAAKQKATIGMQNGYDFSYCFT